MPSSFAQVATARGGADDEECPAANPKWKVEAENRSSLESTGTSTDGRGAVRSADLLLLRGMRGVPISHPLVALSV